MPQQAMAPLNLSSRMRESREFLGEVYDEWSNDNVMQLSAGLAFYTVFSLAPLLLIALAVATLAFGREAARGELMYRIENQVGPEAARVIQALLSGTGKRTTLATGLGAMTAILGATVVFVALQDALNSIWDVMPKPETYWKLFFKKRLLSFAMILGIGVLLVVAVLVSAAISFGEGYLHDSSIHFAGAILQAGNAVGSLIVFTLVFGLIYKVLPDVKIQWHDVWVGAFITSVLFTAGKYFISIYLGYSTVGSAYGAAGSLVVLLVWIYYSSIIFLTGGEIAQVYSRKYGSGIIPDDNAMRTSPPPSEPPPSDEDKVKGI